jgi:hypothetical protein
MRDAASKKPRLGADRLKAPVRGIDYDFVVGTRFPIVNQQEVWDGRVRNAFNPADPAPKIICVGCSFTYGKGVSARESYPGHLQQLVTPRYKVMNMGRRNYGLKLIVEWYRRFGAPLKPAICVVQVPDMARQPFPGLQPNESIYYTANFGARVVLFEAGVLDSRRMVTSMESLMEQDLRRLVTFISELKRQRAIPVVLIYRGAFSRLEMFANRYYRMVEQKMKSLGVLTVAGSALSWRSMDWLKMLLDHSHPNSDGNAILAAHVARAINSREELSHAS